MFTFIEDIVKGKLRVFVQQDTQQTSIINIEYPRLKNRSSIK